MLYNLDSEIPDMLEHDKSLKSSIYIIKNEIYNPYNCYKKPCQMPYNGNVRREKIEVYISWEPKLSLIFKLYDDNGMTCQKISVVTWEQWVDTTYDDGFIIIF